MDHARHDGEEWEVEGTGGSGPSLLEYGQFLLRNRRRIFLSAFVPMFLVALLRSFGDPGYTSSATFMPQATDPTAGLSGLAEQFGLGLAGAADNESPAFYADLLQTREVLTSVFQDTYSAAPDSTGAPGRLVDILDIDGSTPGLVMENGLKELSGHIAVDVRTRTGVVVLTVSMKSSALAQQVSERLLDAVNRFNLEQRQSQAGAERAFNEQRLTELGAELRAAEDQLQAFLSKNRDYHSSPELSFQQDRLARVVAMKQAVYETVAQAYEQARMSQVRNTPVITIIERPSLPAKPEGRGRAKYGLLFGMLGGVFGLVVAFGKEYAERRRAAGDQEFAALVALLRETLGDWTRFFRFGRSRQ